MSTENKVFITPEGEHDYNQKYEQYSIVTHTQGDIVTAYLSIKPVPPFISITDKNFWKLLNSGTDASVDISGKADKEVTPTVIIPSVDGSVINLTAEEIENFRVGDIIKDNNSLDGSYKNFFVVSVKNDEVILVYIDNDMLFPVIFTKNGSTWSYDMTQGISFSDLDRKTIITSSQPQGGMRPNIFYNLGVISSNTTFSLFSSTDNTHLNMYMWSFETGDNVPTITWPSVTWCDSADTETVDGVVMPVIEPNKHYEISIMNGYGTIISADIPQTEVEP